MSDFARTRNGHIISVQNLNGKGNRQVKVKANHRSSSHPVHVSSPPYFLLSDKAAMELADLLVDLVETREQRQVEGEAA